MEMTRVNKYHAFSMLGMAVTFIPTFASRLGFMATPELLSPMGGVIVSGFTAMIVAAVGARVIEAKERKELHENIARQYRSSEEEKERKIALTTIRNLHNKVKSQEEVLKKIEAMRNNPDIELAMKKINNELDNSLTEIGGGFNSEANQLTSLDGAPKKIDGGFHFENNHFKSLDGTLKEILDLSNKDIRKKKIK